MQRCAFVEKDLTRQPLIRLVARFDPNALDLLPKKLAQGELLERRGKADNDTFGFSLCGFLAGSRGGTQ
jgi:hypothetical protein